MTLPSWLGGGHKTIGMGEGGYLLLINGSAYTWKRGSSSSYQMTQWKFPGEIKPGTVATVYVEFKQTITTTRSDTSGYCNYSLQGCPGCSIRIEVTDAPSNLKVQLQNLETPNNASGGWIPLGWQHDGIVCFVLSGKKGTFSSSNPPRDWMQQNLGTLGSRPLYQICMPGTHDAGMGDITHVDVIPKDIMAAFTQTQSLTILGQLQMGSRYFDIRPEISGGQYWTGHYSGGSSHLGARGQKMSSIVDDVNQFTQMCAELIILNMSHSLQSDEDWREFTQAEWTALYKELTRLDHRFAISAKPDAGNLSLLTLSTFIGAGKAAVVVVIEAPGNITLGTYGADQGFYLPAQLNVYNEYSNTNDCVEMVQDQLQKMRNFMPSSDKRLFLISWTLTQQEPDFSVKDFTPPNTLLVGLDKVAKWEQQNKTIRLLAYSANKALLTDLLPATGKQAFPNIVYIDFMENRNYVAVAMAINDQAFTNTA